MSVGLGMTPEEWEGLRTQVDDSFWVMRIIGLFLFTYYSAKTNAEECPGYPPLFNDHDGFSCGAHKYVSPYERGHTA